MSIALRSTAVAHNFGSSSVTCNVPAGVVDGDVMVAFAFTAGSPQGGATADAAWGSSLTNAADATNGIEGRAWVRVASGEPASYSFGVANGTDDVVVLIAAYTGVVSPGPVDASNSQGNASSVNIVAPSVTAANANEMLVGSFGVRGQGSGTIGAASGMTAEVTDNTFSGNSGLLCDIEDQLLVASGATGTRTATAPAAARNVGLLVLLIPAGGGGGGAAPALFAQAIF